MLRGIPGSATGAGLPVPVVAGGSAAAPVLGAVEEAVAVEFREADDKREEVADKGRRIDPLP